MSARDGLLRRLQRQHVLRPLDAELGCLMLTLDAQADPLLGLATAATSLALAQGHSCLPLSQLAAVLADAAPTGVALPACADVDALRGALEASALVGRANAAATTPRQPLQLDGRGRLYLNRYFGYECAVALDLTRRLARRLPEDAWPVADLRRLLQTHFALDGDAVDWQAVAVLTGLVSPLTVITGGPGTGKTTTVLWLLAALVEQARAHGRAPLRMHLAAPTGKAAARLGESLRGRLADMAVHASIRDAIPSDATTLHRLLGVRAASTRFRHHREHPLATDVVVVDEASMIDLPLMAKLLDALPAEARLVLLGDRDQLASVEAGNVLAGICQAAGTDGVSAARARRIGEVTGFALSSSSAAPGAFADAVIELRDSHRFGAGSGLGQLARCIREGDAQAVLDGLQTHRFDAVDRAQPASEAAHVIAHGGAAFAALASCRDPAEALRRATRMRVLTALREGPSGCIAINAALEHVLRQRAGVPAATRWYPGRLLLITENDSGSGLFNGDIGIVLQADDGRLGAWFPAADGGVCSLPLQALPAHDSAFAMTIHKSQGSEFDEAVIVLPREDARVLGRELLYTAVTRARQRITLIATDVSLQHAITRSTRRYSGLFDMLRRHADAT